MRKVLSICIPSYDRFEVLNKCISSILLCQSDEFEIVVIDNGSKLDIRNCITFEDNRLRIICRDVPVYGVQSVNEAVGYANGQFAMLLLDKDYIDGRKLERFIESLKEYNHITGGYCELNSQNRSVNIIDENRIERVGFLSKHPSGDFYRTDIIKEYMQSNQQIVCKDPFAFDIYLGYCASSGTMMVYDCPLVESALSEIKQDDKISYTFNPKSKNVYYFPQNRIQELIVFCECLYGFGNINRREFVDIGRLLYKKTISQVTSQYKWIMGNKSICAHYGHGVKNVSKIEMIWNILRLYFRFINHRIEGINICDKTQISLGAMYDVLRHK